MGLFDRFSRRAAAVPAPEILAAPAMAVGPEERHGAENPGVPVTASNFLQFFDGGSSRPLEPVSVAMALRVPAFAAGVNFIAGTMAGLPLGVYRKTTKGRVEETTGVAQLLSVAVNPGMSAFEFIRWLFETQLTQGRAVAFIEKSAAGQVISLWPMDPLSTEVFRHNGRKGFRYRENGRVVNYDASEVLDLPFMLAEDGLTHRSPVMMGSEVLRLAIEMTAYGAKLFKNGGVPPFAIKGGFQSVPAMERASGDFEAAVRNAAKSDRLGLVLPAGMDIVPMGVDADKMQLLEAKRFVIEEIARILGLPPVFLQDLTHATLANVEQQDIHLTKHVIKRFVEQFEAEANLKLFGWKNRAKYVEFSMDGLLRGDFKSRSEAIARAIMTGQMTPGEARDQDNRPRLAGDDILYMQGAMVPLTRLATGDGGKPAPVGDDQGMDLGDGGDNDA
jgi:HK97 family phage portal protein